MKGLNLPKRIEFKSIDLSFLKKQPRYVLYGAGCILVGIIFLVIGLVML